MMLRYEARKFFPFMTLWLIMLSVALPFYVQANMEVRLATRSTKNPFYIAHASQTIY